MLVAMAHAAASGNILRMNPDGTTQEVFVNSGGRVLGFDFHARAPPHRSLPRGVVDASADGLGKATQSCRRENTVVHARTSTLGGSSRQIESGRPRCTLFALKLRPHWFAFARGVRQARPAFSTALLRSWRVIPDCAATSPMRS
jgi:hypothetical protein